MGWPSLITNAVGGVCGFRVVAEDGAEFACVQRSLHVSFCADGCVATRLAVATARRDHISVLRISYAVGRDL